MITSLQLLRFIIFLGVLFIFSLLSLGGHLWYSDKFKQNKFLSFILKIASRFLLFVFNHHVKSRGVVVDKNQNCLIVSNHLSYLDVLIIASRFPSSFVTSVEVKNTAGLGLITKMAGCFYVERRSRANLGGEVGELSEALKFGCNVVVFPEATSTNGEGVLKFKRPLFEAAIQTKKSVLPVTINYKQISDQNLSTANRDFVCWYGDMKFLGHFWKLIGQTSVDIELVVHAPITGNDTSTLAQATFDAISKSYIPITNDSETKGVSDVEEIKI
jgi:1-acyl-sn-glycerol-3-phosphate acyltransferase